MLRISNSQWVNVVKEVENQYSNGTAMLEVEESCITQVGGELKILGFSPDTQSALVENLTGALGTPCPVGAIFFISVNDLQNFEKLYIAAPTIKERFRDFINWIKIF